MTIFILTFFALPLAGFACVLSWFPLAVEDDWLSPPAPGVSLCNVNTIKYQVNLTNSYCYWYVMVTLWYQLHLHFPTYYSEGINHARCNNQRCQIVSSTNPEIGENILKSYFCLNYSTEPSEISWRLAFLNNQWVSNLDDHLLSRQLCAFYTLFSTKFTLHIYSPAQQLFDRASVHNAHLMHV